MASRFSLRRLFGLVTVSALIIAGLWYATAEYRKRQAIQSDLFNLGASYVRFGRIGGDDSIDVGFQKPIAGDLAKYKRLGIVEFKGYSVTRNCLTRLSDLSRVEAAYFISCDLPEGSLEMLVNYPQLDSLLFWNTNLTDRSIETLGKLKRIKSIAFKNTQVTESAADRLREVLPDAEVTWLP